MRKSRYSEEQIIGMLREHDAGVSTKEICRKYWISDATFYKYRAKFDGMTVSDAQRLKTLEAENTRLKRLLADPGVEKLFHFARFDVAVCLRDLQVETAPVFCTKIASKLVRTYTDRHGLKDVAREIAGVELSKQQQSSDWAAADLSDAQLASAAADVLHLHAIADGLAAMLEREGRMALAQACFAFLPTRARLDLAGWQDVDIFAHS